MEREPLDSPLILSLSKDERLAQDRLQPSGSDRRVKSPPCESQALL